MIVELARVAYDAWWREAGEHVGPMMPWDELPNGIKNAWNAALEAAFDAVDPGSAAPKSEPGKRFAIQLVFDDEDYELLVKATEASGLELLSAWIAKTLMQALHEPPAVRTLTPPGWGQE